MSRLTDLLRLSYVPRWATVPTLRQQSAAEHSYRVAVIAMAIVERITYWCEQNDDDFQSFPFPGTTMGAILEWALIHDGAEAQTSDLPATIKAHLPGLHQVEEKLCPWRRSFPSAQAGQLIKLADLIEALLFIEMWGATTQGVSALITINTQELLDYAIELSKREPVIWAHAVVSVNNILDEARSDKFK